MTASVEVRVNGQIFDAFESGTVNLTMTEAANAFDLVYFAEAVPGQRQVFKGDRVELLIDGDSGKGPETLIEGYVDATSERDTSDRLDLSFAGRTLAQDPIDCSAVTPDGDGKTVPMRWNGVTIDEIVSDMLAPFGIAAFVDVEGNDELARDVLKKFDHFHVQMGEKVIDVIQRAAIKRGLFVYSVGGDIVLARAGRFTTNTVLERGVNVREWWRSDSDYNRFSHYRLRGQAKPKNDNHGAATSQLSYAIQDDGVTRYRPLLIEGDAHDGIDLKQRAQMERAMRGGQSENITAYVLDWTTAEGYCWRPNTLVHVKNHVIGVDARLIVATARYRFGPNELREVQLELTRPEAFDLAKYPALGRGKMWFDD